MTPRLMFLAAASVFIAFAYFAPTIEACDDIASQCSWYKQYCEDPTYGAWTKQNCKKTCGLCDVSWSACSKTCGEGTKYRENCQSGGCKTEFNACNTHDCPSVTCDYRYTRPRYRMTHSCCNPTPLSGEYSCGRPNLNTRVRGGENTIAKQWPWMALIKAGSGLCGGVLINSNFVLSAAHCFTDDYGRSLSTVGWSIYFGVLKLNQLTTGVGIKSVKLHPQYNFPANDIAVVELKSSVTTTSSVQPICLPGGEVTPLDTTCYVTGWGISQHSNGATQHLQQGAIQNLDLRICQNAFAKIPDLAYAMPFINGNQGYLCAGSLHKAVDSCEGDSGGPLVCQRCSTCSWYVAGIVSLGHPNCGTIGVPAVYSRVRDYEDWVVGIAGMSKVWAQCTRSVGP